MKKKPNRKRVRMKRIVYLQRVFILALTFIYASSFSTRNSTFYIKPAFTPEFMISETPWADSVLNALSLEEKIAQLLMVQVFSNGSEDDHKNIEKLIEKHKIGGILFSRGGPGRQSHLTNKFQSLSDVPLLIAMDAEWGLGMRLDSTVSYPYQMTLGAINDNSLIYELGTQVAEQCKRLGVNMNVAPVVDINNNPKNPVINYRSFGEDRDNVMGKGLMYMLGMQDNKLLTTIKHFPGHGDTEKDSHLTLPRIDHSRKHLDSIEIYPFEQLINNGAAGVMTAHLFIPALDSTTNLPSSLSYEVTTELLKRQLGFGGLTVSDALQMRGVSDYFARHGQLDVLAFKAGNDILLMPADVSKAINQIKREVRRGRISEEDIDKSCHKILKAKEWVGLDKYKPIEIKNLYKDLNKPEYYVLKNKLLENSITLLKNKNNFLPIRILDTLNIAVVSLNAENETAFQKTVNLYLESDRFVLDTRDYDETQKIIDSLNNYNTILIAVHNLKISGGSNYGIKPTDIEFIDRIGDKYNNVILSLFVNAYGLRAFKTFNNIDAVTIAFQPGEEQERMIAQALFGGMAFKGKMPVRAHREFNLHTGYSTVPSRLKYSFPEYAGIRSDSLDKIEKIVKEAIKSRATPGCQVFIAHKGVVVYNKAFGHQTYRKKKKVELSDVYDIASLTKIFATTHAVMKLYEENKINIDTALSNYLPYLDTTNKKDLVIKEIMTHRAMLPAWIPFYMSTLEGLYPEKELFSNQVSDFYPLQYWKHTYITRFLKHIDDIYTVEPDIKHNVKVADGMYILNSYRDSIFNKIASCELLEENHYKYSDLGFYLLYDAIEKITKTPFEEYVNENLYAPIGAKNTTYLPLQKISRKRIAPTEDDLIFRRQLIQGYVHDPGAAMLGGVSGHAGLFANANDLGKIMQMWLNGGEYGYKKYLDKKTLELFTSCPFCDDENRRGIGFDKPPIEKEGPSAVSFSCSPSSFGHTGFTGTIAWADPEKELIYIFISNRVHPDQNNNKLAKENFRTRIQDVIYNSIIE